MNRRSVLAAVTAGFGATAGCLGLFSSGSDSTPSGGESNEPPTGGESPTNGVDGETGTGSPAVTGSCPSSLVDGTDVQRVICDGKQSDAEMFLAADSDAVSLPSGTIEFTFRNRTGGSKLYDPCRWAVYRQSDQGWEVVRPLEGGATEEGMLREFETLTLYIGREPPTDAGQCPYTLDEPTPDRHLFGVQGQLDGEKTLFLASFEVTESSFEVTE